MIEKVSFQALSAYINILSKYPRIHSCQFGIFQATSYPPTLIEPTNEIGLEQESPMTEEKLQNCYLGIPGAIYDIYCGISELACAFYYNKPLSEVLHSLGGPDALDWLKKLGTILSSLGLQNSESFCKQFHDWTNSETHSPDIGLLLIYTVTFLIVRNWRILINQREINHLAFIHSRVPQLHRLGYVASCLEQSLPNGSINDSNRLLQHTFSFKKKLRGEAEQRYYKHILDLINSPVHTTSDELTSVAAKEFVIGCISQVLFKKKYNNSNFIEHVNDNNIDIQLILETRKHSFDQFFKGLVFPREVNSYEKVNNLGTVSTSDNYCSMKSSKDQEVLLEMVNKMNQLRERIYKFELSTAEFLSLCGRGRSGATAFASVTTEVPICKTGGITELIHTLLGTEKEPKPTQITNSVENLARLKLAIESVILNIDDISKRQLDSFKLESSSTFQFDSD